MCCEKGKTAIASFNRNHCDFLLSGLSLVRSEHGEMEAEATSVQSFCQNSATPPLVWGGGGELGPATVAMLLINGCEAGGAGV